MDFRQLLSLPEAFVETKKRVCNDSHENWVSGLLCSKQVWIYIYMLMYKLNHEYIRTYAVSYLFTNLYNC